jgi:pimeloyl-ACP methyl ester carboxylesterase
MRRGRVEYARSGELSIAYEVTGGGPLDLVLVPGFLSQLDKDWEEPRHAHFLERLGSFSRLVRFDKRGTGLSDRPPDVPDLETRMDDVRAVMDAAGSERAVLFGYSEGAPMSILFAASHPERVVGLVVCGGYAKRMDPDEDYPWAPTVEERLRHNESILGDAGFEAQLRGLAPSADEAMARWWGERCRAAASPAAVRALLAMNSRIDVRSLLPSVHVPTLVVHRVGDLRVRIEEGRYIAERIPGARLVELPGDDHFVAIDPDQLLDPVEAFVAELAGIAPAVHADRSLATVVVADIADSTETVTRLGDRAWADLLARHHELVRAELARHAGEEIDVVGDGFLALFDGPSRAIRYGVAIADGTARLGLSVRVGLHTGEIERRGHAARGIAVHLAARVAAEAEPGEVLVTATTRDLVAGSGLQFGDRGERLLKGFDEPRRLYAVER